MLCFFKKSVTAAGQMLVMANISYVDGLLSV